MINATQAPPSHLALTQSLSEKTYPQSKSSPPVTDRVELGAGAPLSDEQAMGVVVERAYEKLRAAVDQARTDLGFAPGEAIDTSAEATAGRIADFAIGFFNKYAENNDLEDTEEGRQQYADFIGEAINQGIGEARDILTALNSLNGETDNKITAIAETVQSRLDDFVANGIS